MRKVGDGTLILTGNSGNLIGDTYVADGTVQLGNGGTAGTLSPLENIIIFSGATFAVNQSDTVTQGTDFSSSAISGAGKIAQSGTGTLVLNAANTYSGGTDVNQGTLTLNNASGAGTGTINVGEIGSANTATLNVGNSGLTVANDILVQDGTGTRTVGSTHTSGSTTYSGSMFLDEAVTLSAGSGGTTIFSGNIEDGLGAGTYGVTVNAPGGNVQFTGATANSGTLDYTVQAGTLELGKTAGVTAIDSDITVASGATLRILRLIKSMISTR